MPESLARLQLNFHEIDAGVLPELTDADLTNLGLPLRHRDLRQCTGARELQDVLHNKPVKRRRHRCLPMARAVDGYGQS
jgi:hypothetical protein